MSARIWVVLLVCQTLWSGSYVAMKFASAELPVGAVVVLRYGCATAGYLLLAPAFGVPRLERRDWLLVIALGALNFTLAPSLQVASMTYTQAIDVSILTALEPALTVALAALVLREKPGRGTLGALAVGMAGMLLLSGAGWGEAGLSRDRLFGNGLFLTSLLFEISVTVAGARLARRYAALPTMAAMKACGFLLAAVVYAGPVAGVDFAALSWRTWASIAYLGLLASLFSYTAWYWVIRRAEVHQAALSLLVQPLTGTAIGYFLAGETITLHTLIGGGLIVGSLVWRLSRPPRPAPV